jgi:hypothetical protein
MPRVKVEVLIPGELEHTVIEVRVRTGDVVKRPSDQVMASIMVSVGAVWRGAGGDFYRQLPVHRGAAKAPQGIA